MSERVVRAALVVAGVAALVFGGVELLGRPSGEWVSIAVWFTVPAVLSDLVVLPAVAVAGWLVTAKLPAATRLPVQVGATVIGVLTLVAAPFLGRPGLRADNPTLLDRNYVLGWAVYVGIAIVAAGIWALVRHRSRRLG